MFMPFREGMVERMIVYHITMRPLGTVTDAKQGAYDVARIGK